MLAENRREKPPKFRLDELEAWMKNNILLDYRFVYISYRLLYRYKLLRTIPAAISCGAVDEFLNADSLPTN